MGGGLVLLATAFHKQRQEAGVMCYIKGSLGEKSGIEGGRWKAAGRAWTYKKDP